MKILNGKKPVPRRCLLYGVHGIGKSSWAAQAPGAVFFDFEDGLNDIDCSRTEHLLSMEMVDEACRFLETESHQFQTLVIDSADWLERRIWDLVAERGGKKSIEDFEYGKGYKLAGAVWQKFLKRLDWIRTERQMTVVILAHSQIEKQAPPGTESYDRYSPALHKTASAMVQEWCDEVFFASFQTYTKTEDEGFGKKRIIALGGTDRIVRTQESATALAKNRLAMPAEIEFSWSAYSQHISGNISGVVVDGSSKKKEA